MSKETEVYTVLSIGELCMLLDAAKRISKAVYGGFVERSTIVVHGKIDSDFPQHVWVDVKKTNEEA